SCDRSVLSELDPPSLHVALPIYGFGNGIMLSNEGKIEIKDIDAYAFGILQAARVRTSKTEFISCPGCGRTLFDLQTTVALVKKRSEEHTSELQSRENLVCRLLLE